MSYENILVELHDKVGLIRLNRPQALNALSSDMMKEVSSVLQNFETDEKIHAVVLTGNDKAFAAGADIKAIKDLGYMDLYKADFIMAEWEQIARCRKPIIAAVAGYALGGGCEIAMMCDFILAANNAKFGQPEISIGTLPGAGGSQRLTRLVGKSKAMETCLTGRMMDAEEAERAGLVSRIVPLENLVDEAMTVAKKIAEFSLPMTMMVKEAVNCAYETSLSEGIRFERRLFYSSFSTSDQKEGMKAFTEKRKPTFTHQ